jgi:hypothetical protein
VEFQELFTVYRPFNHAAFLRELERLAFQEAKWLYASGEMDRAPLQGDIFPEIELQFTNSDGGPETYIGPAMLVANSCDAVPEQDLVAAMAPVQEVTDYLEGIQDQSDWKGRVDTLRRNRFTSRFYLPAVGTFPERYVDFAFTAAVSTRRIRTKFEAQQSEILRLSERGWYLLTGKLAHHFARGSRE